MAAGEIYVYAFIAGDLAEMLEIADAIFVKDHAVDRQPRWHA